MTVDVANFFHGSRPLYVFFPGNFKLDCHEHSHICSPVVFVCIQLPVPAGSCIDLKSWSHNSGSTPWKKFKTAPTKSDFKSLRAFLPFQLHSPKSKEKEFNGGSRLSSQFQNSKFCCAAKAFEEVAPKQRAVADAYFVCLGRPYFTWPVWIVGFGFKECDLICACV